MSVPAIRVEKLSKQYQIGANPRHTTFRDALSGIFTAPLRRLRELSGNHRNVETFWALQDVSFEVQPGEVVGVIGRNGAGKSTLLKILSQITEPTSGRVEMNGRVGSLLEVGSGFHPELTGRENVYLNGAILGMSRVEIRRKFDEIVAFAEMEKFIDTPVKRYSSGMYMRLAFAVAAHLEPEILIIDEVLAVGDIQFQKKCLGKIESVGKDGRTVLFVSHNIPSVRQLTRLSILLDRGNVLYIGPTDTAISRYLESSVKLDNDGDVEHRQREFPNLHQELKFIRAKVANANRVAMRGEPIVLEFLLRASVDIPEFRFSGTLFAGDGEPVGSWFSANLSRLYCGQELTFQLHFRSSSLAPGKYCFGVSVGRGDYRTGHVDFDIIMGVLHFEIMPDEGDQGTLSKWAKNWGPIVFPAPQCLRLN